MSWAGLDQRVFPRFKVRCDITIDYPIGGTIRAQTQNLGAGGVCVILQRELEKLSTVHLELSLQEILPPIQCDGRVVWMVRSKEFVSRKTSFDTGIEFVNLKLEDQERISSFIKGSSSPEVR